MSILRLYHLRNYHKETRQFKNRVIKSILLALCMLAILIYRALDLQVFNYKLYSKLATNNQLAYLPIEPNRGLIYDRNGILLADNRPIFNLNLAVAYIKNIDSTLERLQTIIKITPKEIQQTKKAMKNSGKSEYIPIKFKLSQEEVASFYVNQHRFPGVYIDTQMIRYYPLGEKTAHPVGYLGRVNKNELQKLNKKNYQASNFIGKVGIEKYYEDILHGKTGYKVAEVDASGNIVRTVKITPPIPGDTLHLTIDSKLQEVVQKALGNEKGAVVVIDPNNGEVLALVSNPTYDPNLFTGGIDTKTFSKLNSSKTKPMYNRATKSIFPLASTIKPFVALQALDTETITPSYTISDPGWFRIENSKHTYRDWKYGGHDIVNVTKAIEVSCDTFFYTISIKLGIKKIAEILTKFGFGQKTNIDILEESSGIVATPQYKKQKTGAPWYIGDTVISSIGQGFMSATPLQLAHGTATIAMRGNRFKPTLLKSTQKPNGEQIINNPITLDPVNLNNHKNWDIITKAMEKVVTSPMGTGYRRFGQNLPYTVAGKTGGAQLYHHKIVNENPTPEDEKKIPKHLRNHSLFIAFAPIEKPKIALAAVTENCRLAPTVARKILDYYLVNTKSKSTANDNSKNY